MISILRTVPFLLFTALLVTFSTVQAADVSGFDLGHVEIQVLGSAATVNMGQYAEIGKFRVSNRTGRNLVFDSLRLRNYGTADLTKSLENINVTTTTGENLGELVSSSRKYLTWRFNENLELSRGDSIILSVRARLIYAKRGQTVQLGLRRDEDLNLNDRSSGFGIRCTNCEGTRLKTQRLDTGGVYITRTPTYRASNYRGSRSRIYSGAAYESQFANTQVLRTNTYRRPTSQRYISTPRTSQQYSPGAKDVVFFSSRINSRLPVAVDGIFLSVAGSSGNVDEAFGDWQLLVNGQREGSTSRLESRNGQMGLLFDSSMDLPANAQIVVVGRVKNNAQTGNKVQFRLNGSGLIDPEYLTIPSSVNTINGGNRGNYSGVR